MAGGGEERARLWRKAQETTKVKDFDTPAPKVSGSGLVSAGGGAI